MGTDEQNKKGQLSQSRHGSQPAVKHKRPRQIIICCDGTNNTLTGGPRDTNVLKLISHLVPGDEDQVLYYDPGVGSPDQLPSMGLGNYLNRKRERVGGLVKGRGIYENIAEAYLFLVEKYQEGDEIYIFGFSRGAFTARCVGGMVNLFGLIRSDSKPLILTLIRVYFSTPSKNITGILGSFARRQAKRAHEEREAEREDRHNMKVYMSLTMPPKAVEKLIRTKRRLSTREEVALQVKEEFTSPEGKNAIIHFVGVWDTVASVGLPIISKRSITSDGRTRGDGERKRKAFRHIRHALSMDEHRSTFEPRLYWDPNYQYFIDDSDNEVDGISKDPYRNRSLHQRWFRGVHSDVGGGYVQEEAGLANQSYLWMLDEAEKCGLRTDPAKIKPNPLKLPLIAHDQSAVSPYWSLGGLTVRHNKIPAVEDDSGQHKDKEKAWKRVWRNPTGKSQATVPITNADIIEGRGPIHLVPYFKNKGMMIAFMTLLALALFVFACRFAFWSIFAQEPPASYIETLRLGGACLDYWQRNHWPIGCPIKTQVNLFRPEYAYAAILVDIIFILVYGWLLGLFAGWAFREVTLGRRPINRVSPLLWLGWAPCLFVFADMTENLFSILTIWLLHHQINGIPDYSSLLLPDWLLAVKHYMGRTIIPVEIQKIMPSDDHLYLGDFTGGVLMAANIAKWAGLAGSILLVTWGIAHRVIRAVTAASVVDVPIGAAGQQ